MSDTAPIDRRGLLRLGLGSSLLLAGGGIFAGLAGCAGEGAPPAAGFGWLREADLGFLRPVMPLLLDGLLPVEAAAREQALDQTLRCLDRTAQGLQPPAQRELRKLFDLLASGVTRRLTTGVAAPWPQAQPAQIAAFLDRWRGSSVGLFNAGYRVLVKLSGVAFFTQKAGWQQAGYPGPPAWALQAVGA